MALRSPPSLDGAPLISKRDHGLVARVVDAYSLDLERIGDRAYLKSARADGIWLSHALRLERLAWNRRRRSRGNLIGVARVSAAAPSSATILRGASDLDLHAAEEQMRRP